MKKTPAILSVDIAQYMEIHTQRLSNYEDAMRCELLDHTLVTQNVPRTRLFGLLIQFAIAHEDALRLFIAERNVAAEQYLAGNAPHPHALHSPAGVSTE